MFEEYRFLRYYIPGSLYVIYMAFLVAPYLSENIRDYLLLKNPNVLLGLFAGAFGASLALGYVIYTIYDSILYEKLAMKKERPILEYLMNRINGWCNLENYEKKEFIDTLYHLLGESDRNEQFVRKIRGIWSNFNSRVVCSIFVPFSCGVTIVLLLIIEVFSDVKLFSIGTSGLLGEIGQISYLIVYLIVMIIISCIFWHWKERPYWEALTLEGNFLKSKIEKDGEEKEFERLTKLLLGATVKENPSK